MTWLLAACLVLGACGDVPRSGIHAGAKATPVTLSTRPDPSATDFDVTVMGGSCGDTDVTRLDHAEVQETEAAVTVTAFTYVDNPRPKDATSLCAGVGLIIPVRVRLLQPLGMRDVLDGACQPPAPLGVEGGTGGPCPAAPPAKPDDPLIGNWKVVDAGPLATRGEPKAVWTGTEVIVIGGLLIDQYQALSDGAAFDPATGRWRRIAGRPAPGRVLHAVWTGTELFTLGSDGIGLETLTTAFAYNPATDRWRQVPLPPSTKVPHAVVWTGQRVLAWQPGAATPGALYDPDTDRWSPIPAISVPGAVSAGAAVWTGHELAVEGAVTPEHGGPVEQRLFLLDPRREAWRVSSKPPSELSTWPFLVPGTVGGRVVLTGRPEARTLIYDPAVDGWRSVSGPPTGGASPALDSLEGRLLVSGTGPLDILDLEAGSWSTSGPPPGPAVGDGTIVATGKGVLAFGITTNGNYARAKEPNAAYLWTP